MFRRLFIFLHDGRRIWRAIRSHRAERTGAVRKDLGLAWLDVQDEVAMPGRDSVYRMGVTDLGGISRPVRLTLDFWMQEQGPAEHVGYVVADLMTRPYGQAEVKVTWNSVDGARSSCAGEPLSGTTWFGVINRSGICDVVLSLRTEDGPVDEIRARQERLAVSA